MMDPRLFKQAREGIARLEKLGFTVMTPEAQAAAAQQGAMPPGAPPMDPAATGAAMPPPMDPAAMGAVPPPPMDPAAMGGMPPPPMDPAAMGAVPPPPMDPAAMGGMPPIPQDPVILSLEDLKAIMKEMAGGKEESLGNAEVIGAINDRLDKVTEALNQFMSIAGIPPSQSSKSPDDQVSSVPKQASGKTKLYDMIVNLKNNRR